METLLQLCVHDATCGGAPALAGVGWCANGSVSRAPVAPSSFSSSAPAAGSAAAAKDASRSTAVSSTCGRDDRGLSADRVAALLCFYMDTYGAARSGTTTETALRDALDDAFHFLLSMLLAGAAQHAALRAWLWSGVGAIPFSLGAGSADALAMDGEDEGAGVERSGRRCSGRPFPFQGRRARPTPRSAAASSGAEDAETPPVAPTASEFLAHWAYTALSRQEGAFLAEVRHGAREPAAAVARVPADPTSTTALRLALPDSVDSFLAPSFACSPAAVFALAQQLLLISSRQESFSRGEAKREEKEGDAEEDVPHCEQALLSLQELPPLAVAYAVLESPLRRRSRGCLPYVLAIPSPSAHTFNSSGVPVEAGGTGEDVLLASMSPGCGVLFAVGPHGVLPHLFALPAGFEGRLHEAFTQHLWAAPSSSSAVSLSPAQAPSPAASSLLPSWYAHLRAAEVYDGAVTAAAAMFGFELQVAAHALAASASWGAQAAEEPSGARASNEETEEKHEHIADASGTGASALAVAWRVLLVPSLPVPTPAVAEAHAKGDATAPPAASQPHRRQFGAAWSALLATLALSDGAPGQYVRSVLEESAVHRQRCAGEAAPPSLSCLLHGPSAAAAVEAEREMDRTGATVGIADELGFPSPLFLPTLEELEEDGAPADALASLFYSGGDDCRTDETAVHASLAPAPTAAEGPPHCTRNPLPSSSSSSSSSSSGAQILRSPATLVAVALRHPGSMLHQHEQIFHLIAFLSASQPSTRPQRAGTQEREEGKGGGGRRRTRQGECATGAAAAASARSGSGDGGFETERAEAEEELRRRLINLFSVYAYSGVAGLPPLWKRPDVAGKEERAEERNATAEGAVRDGAVDDAKQEGERIGEGTHAASAPPVQCLREANDAEEEARRQASRVPAPAATLRLKLSLHTQPATAAITLAASQEATPARKQGPPTVATEAAEEEEELQTLLAGATRDHAATVRCRHDAVEHLSALLVPDDEVGGGEGASGATDDKARAALDSAARKGEAIATQSAATESPDRAHLRGAVAGLSPRDLIHGWCRSGERRDVDAVSASALPFTGKHGTPLLRRDTDDGSRVAGKRRRAPTPPRADDADDDDHHVSGRAGRVDTRAHTTPLSEMVSHTLHVFAHALLQTPPAAPTGSTATLSGSRRVLSLAIPAHVKALHHCLDAIATASAAPPSAASGTANPDPDGRDVRCVSTGANIARAVLGGCLTFFVYRTLRCCWRQQSTFCLATLSHVLSVLTPLTRSHRIAAAVREGVLYAPAVSDTLLPDVLVALEAEEKRSAEEQRRAAAAAEAERRRRGVLRLNTVASSSHPVATLGGAGAEAACGGVVKELRAVLTQVGAIV